MTAARSVLLFSYGTLRHKDVQIAIFGHEVTGREDSLPGYTRTITESGEVLYFNIEPGPTREYAVSGIVFEITEQELAAADKYEEDRDYRRILVTLRSGVQAWTYQRV